MSTNTTNFNWILPTVGGDANIWGGADLGLNKNLNSQDSLIRRLMNTFILATPPAELQSGTMWIDNSVSPWVWKVYNSGTTTWIEIGSIDPVANTFTPVSGSGDGFEIGDLKMSSIASNHGKWLICDGSIISRATYSGLAAVYAALTPPYPFGDGDGSTTFAIPDMRGAVAGAIGLSGLTALAPSTPWSAPTTRVLGTYQGEEGHVLTVAELAAHQHEDGFSANSESSARFGIGSTTVPSTRLDYDASQASFAGAGALTSNTGSSSAHNTMQPTVFAGNYFVYTGV